MNKIKLNKSGMTIIELICTIAILALCLYPIYEFLRQGALSWEIGENKTEVVQNARIGLDKMCDEIKHAREFYTINSNQVRFWHRDEDDDKEADPDEILTYSWSGTPGDDLTRQFDSETSSNPLANYVDFFELKFYDSNSVETLSPANVYFVTATLRIKKTGKDTDYQTTMRKSLHPRNIL
jgi:prepilin-type N-terminal cleavage/methylation domain-containing protein